MSRANPFGDLTDLMPEPKAKPVDAAGIERIAQENGFPSRKVTVKPAAAPEPVRQRRSYTTGRNQQINVKATAQTVDRFYRLADLWGCPLGELFDKALDALEQQGLPIQSQRKGKGPTE